MPGDTLVQPPAPLLLQLQLIGGESLAIVFEDDIEPVIDHVDRLTCPKGTLEYSTFQKAFIENSVNPQYVDFLFLLIWISF